MNESRIISYSRGPSGLFGVFEDDGDTGYLYLYEPANRGVIDHLQIYGPESVSRAEKAQVSVVWSDQGTKCAVMIWGGIQAIIDLESDRRIRCDPLGRDGVGIDRADWIGGFERYLEH